MRLFRHGPVGQERPALLDSDMIARDLSGIVPDIAGDVLTAAGRARLAALDPRRLPPIDTVGRIGPCVAGVGKIICVGLNFADHAAETGAMPPTEPILFMKATSAICGPDDDLVLPRGSTKTDWEVELGVVIGDTARDVAVEHAAAHIAGYCVINDLCERAWQLEGTGQWVKGKSADGFGPIGPWLVTADEIADPQNLDMDLSVNGERMQTGSTRTMIFGVIHLVAYISRFMTLCPGDVISTGTPPGVGLGMKPPRYLKDGDVVELGIEKLGRQRQRVVAHPADAAR